MHERVDQDIIVLLENERLAIRSADFAELEKLTQAKEALFAWLPSCEPDPENLLKISSLLATNQTLLAAAIKGVSDAKARLLEIADVQKGLRIYEPTGQMAHMQTAQSMMEKKA